MKNEVGGSRVKSDTPERLDGARVLKYVKSCSRQSSAPSHFSNVFSAYFPGRLLAMWLGVEGGAPGMARSQISGAQKLGLAKKPYSPILGILVVVSTGISMFAAWLLAFDFLGYHAPGHLPHPKISLLLLMLGLSIATVGQLLGAGRNEGIRVRGWVGLINVLHIRLAFAGIAFMGAVLKYAMRGRQIHLYPMGFLTIIAGFFVALRMIAKYVFHIDRRRRAGP